MIEIDRAPGAALGISLTHAKYNNKRCVCIEKIQAMSMSDRLVTFPVVIFLLPYKSQEFPALFQFRILIAHKKGKEVLKNSVLNI